MASTRLAPPTGAAIASPLLRSSSGREGKPACTTGCSTAAPQARGRLSGSLPEAVLGVLRRAGLAAQDESPQAFSLTGGGSSDIWRVELRTGTLCGKRALPRLRVAQLLEAPG